MAHQGQVVQATAVHPSQYSNAPSAQGAVQAPAQQGMPVGQQPHIVQGTVVGQPQLVAGTVIAPPNGAGGAVIAGPAYGDIYGHHHDSSGPGPAQDPTMP